MSKLSIFEKKWLDLVFEGKNQEYGAYKLRQNSSKTTIYAFFSGMIFLGVASGIALVFSSFSTKPIPNEIPPLLDTVIKIDNYTEPLKTKPKKTKPISQTTNTKKVTTPNLNFVVAPKENADTAVPKNDDLAKENNIPGAPGSDVLGKPIISNGGNTNPIVIPEVPKGPLKTTELDKQPFFPGGIQKFYEYVGNNFEKQNLDFDEEGKSIKVLVSFVIEKNGSMTDIEVIRKTTPEIDKEALRVLKSLKTKWEAGIKNGEAVRTQFTLPITVML